MATCDTGSSLFTDFYSIDAYQSLFQTEIKTKIQIISRLLWSLSVFLAKRKIFPKKQERLDIWLTPGEFGKTAHAWWNYQSNKSVM